MNCNRPIRIFSLLLLLLGFCFLPALADETSKRDPKLELIRRNAVGETIFRFNEDAHEEWITKQILVDEVEDNSSFTDGLKDGFKKLKSLEEDEILILEKLAKSFSQAKVPTESEIEATLRLAILLRKKNSPKSADLLNDLIKKAPVVKSKRAQVNLMFALILRSKDSARKTDISAREKDLSQALKLSDRTPIDTMSQVRFFVLLEMGDFFYERYLFGQADGYYMSALGNLKKMSVQNQLVVAEFEAGLYARLIWSSFKGGRRAPTLEYGRQYAEKKDFFHRSLTQSVENEISRALAVSLFEANLDSEFEKFSGNELAGDFGKFVALEALNQYIVLGKPKIGILRSNIAALSFSNTRYFVDYLLQRISLLKSAGEKEYTLQKTNLLIISSCKNGSELRLRFRDSSSLQQRCREFLLNKAEGVALFFEKEALRVGNSEGYADALMAVVGRLSERAEREQRGSLLVLAADFAFRAGFFKDSLRFGDEAFGFPLSQEETKRTFAALVRSSRSMLDASLGNTEHANALSRTHKNYLDSFVAEFPLEKTARTELFLTGLLCLRIGEGVEGALRVRRAISFTPKEEVSENGFLVGGVSALIKHYLKQQDSETAVRDLSGIESELARKNVSLAIGQELSFAISALVRRHSLLLRRKGENTNALLFSTNFAKNNPRSFESASLLKEGIAGYFELGDLRKAFLLSQSFEKIHAKSEFRWEVYLAKAQILEKLLSFRSSVSEYKRACLERTSKLSGSICLAPLKRASSLAFDMKEYTDYIAIIDQQASVEFAQGRKLRAFQIWNEASLRMLALKRFAEAKAVIVLLKTGMANLTTTQSNEIALTEFLVLAASQTLLSERAFELASDHLKVLSKSSQISISAEETHFTLKERAKMLAEVEIGQFPSRLFGSVNAFNVGFPKVRKRLQDLVGLENPEILYYAARAEMVGARFLLDIEAFSPQPLPRPFRSIDLRTSAKRFLLECLQKASKDSESYFQSILALREFGDFKGEARLPAEPLGNGRLSTREASLDRN